MVTVQLLRYKAAKYPVAIRPETVDKLTADEVLKDRCYELCKGSMSPQKIEQFEPKFIIDGGANIGTASIFFANRYPNAKIVAVEPEAGNIEMMQYNLQYYPQVKIMHAALWNRETELAIDDPYHAPSSFMTNEISETSLLQKEHTQGITIETLLRDSGFDYIDILKLDIEGAEKEIFSEKSNYQSWLPYTKILIIELHDRMKLGCSKNLFRAVSWYKYFFMVSGENLIFIREDLL